jgi:hypothetical protein
MLARRSKAPGTYVLPLVSWVCACAAIHCGADTSNGEAGVHAEDPSDGGFQNDGARPSTPVPDASQGSTQGDAAQPPAPGADASQDAAPDVDAASVTTACTSYKNIVGGQPLPASFVPFSSTSFWNQEVPPSPTLLTNPVNGDQVIANLLTVSSGNASADLLDSASLTSQWPSASGGGANVFYATSVDPTIRSSALVYPGPGPGPMWGQHDPVGTTFHIPANALPEAASDHIIVIVQPDGSVVEVEGMQPPATAVGTNPTGPFWKTGDTFTASGEITIPASQGGACGDGTQGPYSGGASNATSVFGSGQANASGLSFLGGQINYEEAVVNHVIPHALQAIVPCNGNDTAYWPAHADSAEQNGACGAGPKIQMGMHLWSDIGPSDVAKHYATNTWQYAIIVALNQYGAYVFDNVGGPDTASPLGFRWGDEVGQFVGWGTTSPWVTFANQDGWSNSGSTFPQHINPPRITANIDWSTTGNSGANFWSHIHVLDPCVARGNCK